MLPPLQSLITTQRGGGIGAIPSTRSNSISTGVVSELLHRTIPPLRTITSVGTISVRPSSPFWMLTAFSSGAGGTLTFMLSASTVPYATVCTEIVTSPPSPRGGHTSPVRSSMIGTIPGVRKSTRLNSSHVINSYDVFCSQNATYSEHVPS